MNNEIAKARKVMRDAFETDPGFKIGYIANINMLLFHNSDNEGNISVRLPNDRDKISEMIINKIFYD